MASKGQVKKTERTRKRRLPDATRRVASRHIVRAYVTECRRHPLPFEPGIKEHDGALGVNADPGAPTRVHMAHRDRRIGNGPGAPALFAGAAGRGRNDGVSI